jgi:hypothetical protein
MRQQNASPNMEARSTKFIPHHQPAEGGLVRGFHVQEISALLTTHESEPLPPRFGSRRANVRTVIGELVTLIRSRGDKAEGADHQAPIDDS